MNRQDQSEWDGIERRAPRTPVFHGETASDKVLEYLVNKLDSLDAKLNVMHMDAIGIRAEVQGLRIDVDEMARAFPKNDEGGRDYIGHHEHHDGMIRSSKKWADIGQDVTKKLFGGIAWVTVCFVAYSIWEAIKAEVKK